MYVSASHRSHDLDPCLKFSSFQRPSTKHRVPAQKNFEILASLVPCITDGPFSFVLSRPVPMLKMMPAPSSPALPSSQKNRRTAVYDRRNGAMASKTLLFGLVNLFVVSHSSCSDAFTNSLGTFHATRASQRGGSQFPNPIPPSTLVQQKAATVPTAVPVSAEGFPPRNETALADTDVSTTTALNEPPAPVEQTLPPEPPVRDGFIGRFKASLPSPQERKKLLPLALLYFCILFNYTILRSTKDVLMVTAEGSGAEVIPFMKTYVNLPAAVAFASIYAKMTDSMELKNVFYACVIPFIVFFASFGAILYPNRSVLHPHGFIAMIASHLPANFGAPLAIIRNWSFAMFYVMAEMWGSVVAALLFWGFANEVTTVPEAKKYYPLFGVGANIALMISGQYIRWVSKRQALVAGDAEAFSASLKYLMGAVVASGGVILATYKHMQDKVVSKMEKSKVEEAMPIKKKAKMSMKESFQFLTHSTYIRDLAILVMCSGLCLNIVEVSWKAKLKMLFPDANSYSAFMGTYSTITGAVTLSMMLLGRTIFSRFGWKTAALVTPTMVGVTGLLFFAINMLPISPIAKTLGTTPLMLAVLVGALQNVMSKSSKYSLFDPCKEMAFIPLDHESKTKGKAAIDVIGVPLGKSGSSLLQQILIFATGSLTASTPYLAVILSGVVYMWFRASDSLSKQFESAMAEEEAKASLAAATQ